MCDHTITDPPYTDHVHANLLGGTKGSKKKLGRVHITDAGFKAVNDELDFVTEILKLTKRWALFDCALEQLGDYKRVAPEEWVRSGIYTKIRAMPQLTGDRPGNRCEGCAILHSSEYRLSKAKAKTGEKMRWNNGGRHAYWKSTAETHDDLEWLTQEWLARPENRKATEVPTAKPLRYAREKIEQFTDVGNHIFDPYAASATYGIAAIVLGRHYTGCEIDPVVFEIALKNLRDPMAAIERRCGMKGWEKGYES
jgi:hypothetical protein